MYIEVVQPKSIFPIGDASIETQKCLGDRSLMRIGWAAVCLRDRASVFIVTNSSSAASSSLQSQSRSLLRKTMTLQNAALENKANLGGAIAYHPMNQRIHFISGLPRSHFPAITIALSKTARSRF